MRFYFTFCQEISMKILRKGKVKDLYELDNGNILFYFSDRVSAFDIKMPTPIARKGEVLCKFAKFWFDHLGTKHHMVSVHDNDKMEVKRMKMIPIECVVRGYFYGTLEERYNKGITQNFLSGSFIPVKAAKLSEPIFDPTTKSEAHDLPITKEEIISSRLLSTKDYDYVKETSLMLYNKMVSIVEKAGFIIADVKFEFGRDVITDEILLGDSLGPDEYRLWLKCDYTPGKIQESYDKQLLRDWLVKIGFKETIVEYSKKGQKPPPPVIPTEIATELSNRYIFAYEKISGKKL
jgi:phosphoribosylaminoimidazole-succinocarboxamide synthase